MRIEDPVARVMSRIARDRAVHAPAPARDKHEMLVAMMPNGQPAPFVMTPEQVCEFAQLSGRHGLRRLERIRANGLQARCVGEETRFLLPDVVRFLSELAPPQRRGGVRRD